MIRSSFFRLRRDRRCFRAVINDDSRGDGQVHAASEYFAKRIANGGLDGDPLDLRQLKSCITDRLDVVSISLDEDDSAHRIFESLNNTGIPLGASDLVRNLIFMNISGEEDSERAYSEHWFPMQESTGDRLDDFFWRYLMMDGSFPRQNETFDEIRRRFESEDTPQPIETLIRFSRFARYYRWLCLLGMTSCEASYCERLRGCTGGMWMWPIHF